MYAIIKTGGKQYRVAEGDLISVEKLAGEAGTSVNLEVLFVNDGKNVLLGDDLTKAQVTAEIVDQYRANKAVIYKFHKRKNYKRKKGHRQPLTKLKITGISVK